MGVVVVSILVVQVMCWVREAMPQQPKPELYEHCGGKWNCRYPWLAEVRFSRNNTWVYQKKHQSRHGILITNKAVLTRAQDLDGYPVHGQDMLPLAQDYLECHRGRRACLYVNLRRPREEGFVEGPYCGHNIIVEKVITHPKFGKTADLPKAYDVNDRYVNFIQHLTNMKYPFAVAVLVHPVDSEDQHQPFIPTAILPRTPLDFLYLLRRVDTLGPQSKLCEYPTYEELKYWGWYSRYSRPNETVIKLRQKQYRDYQYTICKDDGSNIKGYEGWKTTFNLRYHAWRNKEYEARCNKTLIDDVLPYTFLIWAGPYGTLDELVRYQDGSLKSRKKASDDRLGAPIVCDGVLIGITSTWKNRGVGLWDVYIGTTLMRVYRWLVGMMLRYSTQNYHRVGGDSPYFGEHYTFKKRNYRKREYDKSIFELSLREAIIPFDGSETTKISLFGTFMSPIILRGLV